MPDFTSFRNENFWDSKSWGTVPLSPLRKRWTCEAQCAQLQLCPAIHQISKIHSKLFQLSCSLLQRFTRTCSCCSCQQLMESALQDRAITGPRAQGAWKTFTPFGSCIHPPCLRGARSPVALSSFGYGPARYIWAPWGDRKTCSVKSWTSILFKTRFDYDLFWFWKTFIGIQQKELRIF